MTPDELLQPRYKVIADYPNAAFEIGYIISFERTTLLRCSNEWKFTLADYPNLFKKLKWWQERKVEDMPLYVHFKEEPYENYFKVHEHFASAEWCLCVYPTDNRLIDYPYKTLTPATEQEYNEYQQNQKQTII